jgi:hypothetical protein
MASDLQIGTGLGGPQKKGLYKELRQNPYLLGLSAVSSMHPLLQNGIRLPYTVCLAWRLPLRL